MIFLEKLSPYEARRVVLLGFAVVLSLVLIYASISLYLIRQSTNNLTEVVEINNAKITHLYHMRDVIRQRQIILNTMLSVNDPFFREEKSLEFFSVAGDFRKSREKLQKLASTSQEKILLDDLLRLVRIAQPINQKAVSAMKADFNSNKARLLSQQAQFSQIGIMKLMSELIVLENKYDMQFVSKSKQGYESVFFWSVLSALFLIALTATISQIVASFVSQKSAELMQKNTELEKVSKLALEATRTKSAFLATMSHEIRTPLTAIIGFAEMNQHETLGNIDRKSHSQSIVRNGKHLLQVINDILDISKLEADRIEFEYEKFSPFQVLQEVEQVISPQIKKKGLFLEVKYEYPMPEYITGDALRFKQVVLNLCSNAVKFTESGRISIKTSCDFTTQKLIVEVVDTGIGMTEEQVNKVFDVFTQADSTVTRKYGGTGLGLTLSKQFVERMGGKIDAHSLLGIGSRFIITINTGDISNIKRVQDTEKTPEFIKINDTKKVTVKNVKGSILLAEDNTDNQQLYGLLLRKTGAELTIVNNGKEAVDLVKKQNFDLIFMDMQMPVMDGIEATKVLRKDGYQGAIVSLTANAMKQDKDACFAAGCNNYITKPVSESVLFETVYQFLKVCPDDVKTTALIESQVSSDILEIKNEFLSNLPLKLESVKSKFEKGQYELLKQEIHKIKGLGGAFGYPEITTLSLKIEQSLADNNTKQCGVLIQEMEQLIILAGKEFKETRPN